MGKSESETGADPLEPAERPPANGRRALFSLRILAAISAGVILYYGAEAFIPVALALLFALVLSAPVEALHRFRIPRALSATLILLLALAGVAGLVEVVWTPAQQWFAAAPRTMSIIRSKVTPVAKFMNRIDELRQNVGSIAAPGPKSASPPRTVVAATSTTDYLIATRGVIAGIAACVITTLFLLAGGPPMLARMTAAFANNLHAAHVLHVIEKVRAEVGRFYAATVLINLTLGALTAAAMAAWGMPTPYLWGAMTAMLNFIPYAGSALTLIVLTLVAVVTFNHLGSVVGVAGTFLTLATIEGQLVQPLFVGRRLEINPLHIFLGLWFAGMFWGIAGIVLATPTLLTMKVIAENARDGQAMREFLGPNDSSDENFRPLLRRMTDRAQVRAERARTSTMPN